MSAMSNYLEEKLCDVTLRGGTFSSPGQVYLALFTADPTDANVTANEANAGTNYPGYTRVSCGATPASAFTAIDSAGLTQNANVITFPALGGASPVTITHWGIYDASSGGNLLFHGAMTASKQLDPSDVPSFPANSLKITFA